MPLPDEIQQQLGWSPVPVDDSLAGGPGAGLPPPQASPSDQFGGLHPAITQALGWTGPSPTDTPPPGDLPPIPPQTPPLQLPSSQPQPDPNRPASPGGGDYRASTTGERLPPAPPAAVPAPRQPPPSALPSPDRQLANAQAQQNRADQTSLGAIQSHADVDRAQGADELTAFQAHDEAAKRIEAQRAAQQQDYEKTFATKQAYVDSTMKDVDNYKIDQNKYWNDAGIGGHIGWYIGMALSGLGNAFLGMNNPSQGAAPNAVIGMLQQKMHDNVVAQIDEREQLKEKNARAEHALDKYQQFSQDRMAQTNLLDARNDKMLAQQLLTTAAKYKDPQIQANAQGQAAQLMQSSTEKAQKAAEFAAGYDTQKRQLAVSQSSNAIAAGHLDLARLAENRAQKLQDLEYGPGGFKEQELGIKAADEQRKAMQAQKNKSATEGVFDPNTGNGLYTEQGKKQLAQADQLEAAARKDPAAAAQAYVQHLRDQVTTPQGSAQVDRLEQQIKSDPGTAQQVADGYVTSLRNDAKTTELATIPDKEVRAKVQDTVNYGQQVYSLASEVQDFLKKDPSITDRQAWGSLQAKWGSLIGDEAKYLGARASSREFDAISNSILKYNPDSLWFFNPHGRIFGSAPTIGQLDGLKNSIKEGVDAQLKGHGVKDGWVPSAPSEAPAATFGGKTAVESGQDEEPGALQRVGGRIIRPIGGYDSFGLRQDAEESALGRTAGKQLADGSTVQVSSNVGLDPADDLKAQSLIKQADSASNEKRAQIVEQLANPIVANNRPSLAAGLLNLVRAQDPSLYEEVLAKLPPLQAKEIRQFDSARASIGSPLLPTETK